MELKDKSQLIKFNNPASQQTLTHKSELQDINSQNLQQNQQSARLFKSAGCIQTIFEYLEYEFIIINQNINRRFYNIMLPQFFQNKRCEVSYDQKINLNISEIHNKKNKIMVSVQIKHYQKNEKQLKRYFLSCNLEHSTLNYQIKNKKLFLLGNLKQIQTFATVKVYSQLHSDKFQVYDLNSQKMLNECTLQTPRMNMTLACFKNYILVIGGMNQWEPLNTVEAYDIRNQEFLKEFPKLMFPVTQSLATQIGRDKLYMLGACTQGKFISYDFVQVLHLQNSEIMDNKWTAFKVQNPFDWSFSSCYYSYKINAIVLKCAYGKFVYNYQNQTVEKYKKIKNRNLMFLTNYD